MNPVSCRAGLGVKTHVCFCSCFPGCVFLLPSFLGSDWGGKRQGLGRLPLLWQVGFAHGMVHIKTQWKNKQPQSRRF